ncbi:hypothetical protein FRC12_020978 [Ceratobasidium sp. 428]|nr:hypothetical protein FRC12_020978 [Ceratobasidium sp. 428]
MEFHPEWQHDDCPVMAWYKLQNGSSATSFQELDHRRSTRGPFYHEFILLKLTDGVVCRVERFGSGFEISSLRSVGSIAHDRAQWLAKEDLAEATMNSGLITRINFGQEFDILNVLAVCYSIKNTQASSRYTLQEYNCYFLCLAVINGLKQRVINSTSISIIHGSHVSSLAPGLNQYTDTIDNYVDQRINAHADRVARYFLARKAKLVLTNIVQTMDNVWRATPLIKLIPKVKEKLPSSTQGRVVMSLPFVFAAFLLAFALDFMPLAWWPSVITGLLTLAAIALGLLLAFIWFVLDAIREGLDSLFGNKTEQTSSLYSRLVVGLRIAIALLVGALVFCYYNPDNFFTWLILCVFRILYWILTAVFYLVLVFVFLVIVGTIHQKM